MCSVWHRGKNSLGPQRSVESHIGKALHCTVRKMLRTFQLLNLLVSSKTFQIHRNKNRVLFKTISGYLIRFPIFNLTDQNGKSEPEDSLAFSARAITKQEPILGVMIAHLCPLVITGMGAVVSISLFVYGFDAGCFSDVAQRGSKLSVRLWISFYFNCLVTLCTVVWVNRGKRKNLTSK